MIDQSQQEPETQSERLQCLKGTGEGVKESISPNVQEQARYYYTPQQLEEMAARREAIRQRWKNVGHVSEVTDLPVAVMCRPTNPMLTPPETPIPAAARSPLPVQTDLRECPTCKIPIRDDSYGLLRPASNGNGIFRPGVPCPVCSPRVRIIKASRKTEQELRNLFGGANIPDYASSWEFETYPASGDQLAKEDAMAFATQETIQRGLYLWGALGHGKTSLAISILKIFLRRGKSGLYIRAPHFMRLVNMGMQNTERQAAVLNLAYSVTCLILDDLAVEQPTPAAIKQLYELVEERRSTDGLYTVITSNLSINDLEERWRPQGVAPGEFHDGIRVADRLHESWAELELEGARLRVSRYGEGKV